MLIWLCGYVSDYVDGHVDLIGGYGIDYVDNFVGYFLSCVYFGGYIGIITNILIKEQNRYFYPLKIYGQTICCIKTVMKKWASIKIVVCYKFYSKLKL